ncbi:kinase-like protein [Rickenella mellea]|uniref:Kinase-like protein n=1 Tax=Rickenella mellea TaxID=50990 RepID=A0A4Y7PKV2_9AGAM|nr:kinase-like protein [Rickenella mellea]
MHHASANDPSGGSPLLTASRAQDVYRALGHLDLTEQVQQTEVRPRGGGGFSRVYYGRYQSKGKIVNVAIKRMHVMFPNDKDDETRIAKMIAKEIKIWSTLDHLNVLPLLGFIVDGDKFPALVSEWMDHGTILKYIKANRQADLLPLVNGIASGLAYLHDAQVVHADMKSDNIYVSSDGTPLLADFGISRTLVVTQTVNGVKELMGSIRWMASELLNPGGYSLNDVDVGDRTLVNEDAAVQTKKTDVWAFGMVVYELLTGNIPFANLSEMQVIFRVAAGKIPRVPQNTENLPAPRPSLWNLYQNCCETNADYRPEMAEIVKDLRIQTLIYQNHHTPHNIIERNGMYDLRTRQQDALTLLRRTYKDMTTHSLCNGSRIGPLVLNISAHFFRIRSDLKAAAVTDDAVIVLIVRSVIVIQSMLVSTSNNNHINCPCFKAKTLWVMAERYHMKGVSAVKFQTIQDDWADFESLVTEAPAISKSFRGLMPYAGKIRRAYYSRGLALISGCRATAAHFERDQSTGSLRPFKDALNAITDAFKDAMAAMPLLNSDYKPNSFEHSKAVASFNLANERIHSYFSHYSMDVEQTKYTNTMRAASILDSDRMRDLNVQLTDGRWKDHDRNSTAPGTNAICITVRRSQRRPQDSVTNVVTTYKVSRSTTLNAILWRECNNTTLRPSRFHKKDKSAKSDWPGYRPLPLNLQVRDLGTTDLFLVIDDEKI